MDAGTPSELSRFLSDGRREVDSALAARVPGEDAEPAVLHRAMRYTLLLPGKRLRPLVSIACCELLRGRRESVLPAACAVEMIHAASLILDDLPTQDDATLRRGRPTLHRVVGEANATLAAVALLARAFEVASGTNARPRLRSEIVDVLSRAVGGEGLVGGQVVDLASTGERIGLDELEYIHSHKTGSLFLAAAEVGALVAGGRPRDRDALRGFAKNLGLAFQVTDDILDETGDPASTGKDAGMDREHTTFVGLCGVEGARRLVDDLIDTSVEHLRGFGKRAGLLRELAEFVRRRDR
jgi:geranylgeranyl diphosphate synthase type II